ncbi:MAG TPA: hypothetical protein VK427_17360 [Kofleriaceae bacterium]|nr:hypothetical protein [Kofleriaceae bacterium]
MKFDNEVAREYVLTYRHAEFDYTKVQVTFFSTRCEELPTILRARAAEGAGLLELVELVHAAYGEKHYNRDVLLGPFLEAFGLRPRDFLSIVFACEIFGDGASMPLSEADGLFRARLAQLAAGPTRWLP